MPFALVETTNARGFNELSAVPTSWLRGSKSGNILLWPNVKSVAEQEKMLRDETSCPKKSWLKYKCKVKRNPISTFAAAKRMLEELSGESSSDAGHLVRRKQKHDKRETENFQSMLVLDNSNRSPEAQLNPIVIEVRGGVQDEIHQESLLQSPSEDAAQHEILPQALTNDRLERLEKRAAGIGTQNDFILDTVRSINSGKRDIELASSFSFKPIKDEQELAELEKKLEDNEFKLKMINWLRLNATGDCADNRMLGALDFLLSREFQTKCTWTGASRKGPKTAIMPNRNVLQLFVEVGSNESETVTQQKLASFFKRKLKNSLKRLLTTGMRRGTRHVRRRRQPAQATEQEVKFEPDGEHNEKRGDRSDQDSDSNASSVINSSDALDAVDVESDSSGPNPNDSSE
ncbi:uncharacterized protein LOC115269187 [Aedes albopictus]|uniref:DUF4806 domain-containing protein n=1 Tax=Aedes albopictus TaxID=7160 RepID=A0ABM2A7D9_AEDAL|nr:uncharacterized protein LOC115269187 [Aedes albopictus]